MGERLVRPELLPEQPVARPHGAGERAVPRSAGRVLGYIPRIVRVSFRSTGAIPPQGQQRWVPLWRGSVRSLTLFPRQRTFPLPTFPSYSGVSVLGRPECGLTRAHPAQSKQWTLPVNLSRRTIKYGPLSFSSPYRNVYLSTSHNLKIQTIEGTNKGNSATTMYCENFIFPPFS